MTQALPHTPTGVETYPFYVKPEDVEPCPECGTMPSLVPVMFLSYNMKCSKPDCPVGYPDAEFIKSCDEAIQRWNGWAKQHSSNSVAAGAQLTNDAESATVSS